MQLPSIKDQQKALTDKGVNEDDAYNYLRLQRIAAVDQLGEQEQRLYDEVEAKVRQVLAPNS